MDNLLRVKHAAEKPRTDMEHGREAEEEEIDVLWDESGTTRYRVLKDNRLVDFEGHDIAWLDEHGNVIDYDGKHRAFYENGVLRDPEGYVVGLGQDPAGPHPVIPNKGLIPDAVKPGPAPKRPKPQKILKKPEPSLLWSKKILEEL